MTTSRARRRDLDKLKIEYVSHYKTINFGSKVFKKEYSDFIEKKEYKQNNNMSISVPLSLENRLFDPRVSRGEYMIRVFTLADSFLKDLPKKPIFETRTKFVMFFLRLYYLLNVKDIIKETDEFILIEGKKYYKVR